LLKVECRTEVDANKHLFVLNILSIKYSMYDVTVTSITVCILCDNQRIRVSATENP